MIMITSFKSLFAPVNSLSSDRTKLLTILAPIGINNWNVDRSQFDELGHIVTKRRWPMLFEMHVEIDI